MGKTYQVTYKTYFNDRLKKVSYHGKLTYPLYVQVTFDRQSIFFKSYYFDLFSKPKYAVHIAGERFGPDIKDIIEKEELLIGYIVDKNTGNFSLDLFKSEYAYYSRDLLDGMEESFLEYLYSFFYDEGLPSLAETIKAGYGNCKLYDLIQDFKISLKPELFKKLRENSLYYSLPYLPLCEFNEKPKRTLLSAFTVMDWEDVAAKERFRSFWKHYYPYNDIEPVLKEIQDKISES